MPHFGNANFFDPTKRGPFPGAPQPLPGGTTFPRRRRGFDPTAVSPWPPFTGGGGSGINPVGGIGGLPGAQLGASGFGSFDPNTSPIFSGIDSDVISDLLEENPQATFSSFINQLRGPQQRFFRNRFQPIRNEFLGLLGSQLRQGQLPTQRFTNFLGGLNFGNRFRSTAPSLRGQGDRTRFAPPTRFLG